MKLVIPSYVKDSGLNDHQLVLMAFLLALERHLGRGSWQSEFVLFAKDVKRILNCNAFPHGDHPEMLQLQQWIDISAYDENNWGFSFKPKQVQVTSNGKFTDMLKEDWVTINDPIAINHWMYLLGRLATPAQLIGKDTKSPLYHTGGYRRALPSHLFKQFCTYVGEE